MKVLKTRDVAQYVLHKQHLLEQSRATSVLHVVNDILALHATSAATPYFSLFSRLVKFQKEMLERELYTRRTLVRLEAMRGTLFITSTALAPLLFQATRISDAEITDWIQKWGITISEYSKLAEYLHSILKEGGNTLPVIKSALPAGMVRSLERRIGKNLSRMTNVNIVLTALMRRGWVVSEKFSEPVLTTSANRYALFRELYPQVDLKSLEADEAKLLLIKRYIEVFGPVTEEDIFWWTGLTKGETQNVLTTLEKELRQIQIKGLSAQFQMLETDFNKYKKFRPSRKTSILLLPYEDPFTKGYKMRTRLIDPEYEELAYDRGAVVPTVLVDGKIIGTWNRILEKGMGPVKISLFTPVKKGIEKALIQTAKAITKVMTDEEIPIEISS